eukprot:528132-Pleurochrysis_carterae.AAC.4
MLHSSYFSPRPGRVSQKATLTETLAAHFGEAGCPLMPQSFAVSTLVRTQNWRQTVASQVRAAIAHTRDGRRYTALTRACCVLLCHVGGPTTTPCTLARTRARACRRAHTNAYAHTRAYERARIFT